MKFEESGLGKFFERWYTMSVSAFSYCVCFSNVQSDKKIF